MFKGLTGAIDALIKKATTHHTKIENELNALHDKRAKRVEEIATLQNTLPQLKQAHEAFVRSFGYSENEIVKEDAVKIKNDITEAIKRYKELTSSLKEIDLSIKALEKGLIDDVNETISEIEEPQKESL